MIEFEAWWVEIQQGQIKLHLIIILVS